MFTVSEMKVLLFSMEYPPYPGGISVAVKRLAGNLSKAGYEVHVLTIGERSKDYMCYEQRNVHTRVEEGVIIHAYGPYSGDVYQCNAKEMAALLRVVEELQKREDFAVFHGIKAYPSGFLSVVAARKYGKKSIVSIRGNDIYLLDFRFFAQTMWTLEHADRITHVSSEQMEFVDLFTDVREKSRVIHNGLDVSMYLQGKIDFPDCAGPIFGFLGLGRAKKGMDTLLLAFEEYRRGNRGSLVLIGGFIPDEQYHYEQLISSLSCKDSVYVVPRVDHRLVLNYLEKIDYFVLPSLEEGCSNALLEALYVGKPAIVTDVGANKDVVGTCGIVVCPGDEGDLVKAFVSVQNISGATLPPGFFISSEMEAWKALYKALI